LSINTTKITIVLLFETVVITNFVKKMSLVKVFSILKRHKKLIFGKYSMFSAFVKLKYLL